MTRKESGERNSPKSSKKAGDGIKDAVYKRGAVGDKNSPRGKTSGSARDIGSNYSEAEDAL